LSTLPPAARLREAIASVLALQSANDVEQVCVALGLAPAADGETPWNSKHKYVARRLHGWSTVELAQFARRVHEEYGDTEDGTLNSALASLGVSGVDGALKQLIFAANGPKPHIVLRDAINNVIEIARNAEYCLVYDRPVAEAGLTWRELVQWWADAHPDPEADLVAQARALYQRLIVSLDPASPPERILFEAFCKRYSESFDLPALIPQVYLHYDPYTKQQLGPEGSVLARQRMDFLLLLPGRTRVVLEVDGAQHYSEDGRAVPARYAAMMAEDRRLRLAGYEVYRFGGHELRGPKAARLLGTFFDQLLARHQG
jgi:hypothetical protein